MEVDNKTKVFFSEAVALTLITADGATVGNIIDTQGFESLTFLLQVGIFTSGTYTITIEHGDDSALSDSATVTITDDPQTLIPALAANLVVAAAGLDRFGYIGKKRFVRLTITTTNFSTTGATVGALALLAHAQNAPTDDQ